MCTSIVEIVPAEGMAKADGEWFAVTHSVVTYDHARHALLADVITLDFINTALPPGARAAVELTLDAAKALHVALAKSIEEAEIEEAERAESIAAQALRKAPARVAA
jgi:fumarylacetoacetate (FAA) hydrolase family protein